MICSNKSRAVGTQYVFAPSGCVPTARFIGGLFSFYPYFVPNGTFLPCSDNSLINK